MKKIISLLLAAGILATYFSVSVSAASYAPYSSYEYNSFGESITTPVGYTVVDKITEASLGVDGTFSNLCDIVVKDNKIYILDSGNSRILKLNSEYKLERIYDNFVISDELAKNKGVDLTDGIVLFTGANGFTIGNDGEIYIADTLSNRVLIANSDCEITDVILRPDAALSDTNAAFSPSAIEVDDRNWIYVASSSIAYGMMVFDSNGVFQNFFGANEVLSTTQAIVQFFRKTFMNITQLEYVEQQTPVTITKMDFDNKGFAYTISPYDNYESTTSTAGLVKKINFSGENILDSSVIFGDYEVLNSKTWFVDVDVSDDGFLNLLDSKNGRVFQYSDDGILVNVFGALGDQVGCFSNAVAIESIGTTILVADRSKNCIYIYKPTEYGAAVQNAVKTMKNGDFENSENAWNELLKLNSNSQLCYEGLGRIYDYKGDYRTAMRYYKMAEDQEDYALAFKQQRQIFVKENLVWILLGILLLITVVIIIGKYLKKRYKAAAGAYTVAEGKYTIEFYSLIHPIDGFSQFKSRNIASYRVSAIIIIGLFLSKIVEFYFTGFSFSTNRNKDFNLLTTVLLTFGIVAIFIISNWALCSLIDGKGTFKDITAVTAYALTPYVISRFLIVAMSNVIVPSESVFIQIISTVGIIWTALVLFLGMLAIHDFTVSKGILSMFLTILGMAVIMFVIVLIFNLLQQIWNLITAIYNEIIFRA